jgi:uncharacterized protein YggE
MVEWPQAIVLHRPLHSSDFFMKNYRLLLLPAALLMMAAQTTALAAEEPAPRIVAVTGQGEVSVRPDRARLNLAADALNMDLKIAEAEVNKVVRNFLLEARQLGAKDSQLSTAGIGINPEYLWDEKARQQKLIGYRARREITVAVDDLDKVGDYLLRATKAGINHVSPPQLESSQADALTRQALVKAANDARDKARLLAEALGMKLGAVRNLRVNDFTPVPMMMKGMAVRAEAAAFDSGNQEMGLSVGEIKYNANASVEFDLLKP